jgi:hypothetical protein
VATKADATSRRVRGSDPITEDSAEPKDMSENPKGTSEDGQDRSLRLLRVVLGAAGAAGVLISFGADAILGGASGFGFFQTILLLFGAGLLVIGLLGRRSVDAYRATAVLGLNTLLLCIATEVTAGVLLRAMPEPELAGKAGSTYYVSQPWGAAYVAEYTAIHGRKMYQPYVMWRTPPFSGTHIDVDARGIRRTIGSQCAEGSYRIFAFGGSTMWGVGSPDWGTIPSYLMAELTPHFDRPLCIENFGEHGHVSTQGVVQLIRELEAGNIPDRVIFYDGVNDVFSAALTGEAGVHYQLAAIRAKLEGTERARTRWLQGQNIYRVVARLQTPQELPLKTLPPEAAAAVVRTYVNNYRIVGMLADGYGFDYDFFWQPNLLVGSKPRSGFEESIVNRLDPAVLHFVSDVYDRMHEEARGREHMHDIADAFDREPGEVYIDWMHVTPHGNRIVAGAIAATLKAAASPVASGFMSTRSNDRAEN